MAKKSKNLNRKNVPATNLSMFGAPPLLEGENTKDYCALRNQIREAVKPGDYIEEMWVEDCAYLYWDTLRLRRQKAALINANMYQGLQVVLETLCPQSEASDLTSRWSVRDQDAIEEIDTLLEAGNLSMEAVAAQALAEIIDKVERIDQMITVSEARRNATLREIERRRSFFAHALRDATKPAEDVEFTELDAPQFEAETAQIEIGEVVAEEIEQEAASADEPEEAQSDEQDESHPNSEAAE